MGSTYTTASIKVKVSQGDVKDHVGSSGTKEGIEEMVE